MIENTDKMIAAILAAARFQKLQESSTESVIALYDDCLAALLKPRKSDPIKGDDKQHTSSVK